MELLHVDNHEFSIVLFKNGIEKRAGRKYGAEYMPLMTMAMMMKKRKRRRRRYT